jgi:hypothetical protein
MSNEAMVALYNPDRVMSLYKYDFDLDTYRANVLCELLTSELFLGVYSYLVRRA